LRKNREEEEEEEEGKNRIENPEPSRESYIDDFGNIKERNFQMNGSYIGSEMLLSCLARIYGCKLTYANESCKFYSLLGIEEDDD